MTFILLHMKVVAVWCDGKGQLSTDEPMASQDDKAMKKIPGQALCVIPAAWMPLMLEGRNPNQNVSLSIKAALLHFECERVFDLVSRCLVLSVSQLLHTDSEGSLP